jgi:competence protein ComEC
VLADMSFLRSLLTLLEKELQNFFVLIPFFIGIGILIFFYLPLSPPIFVNILLSISCIVMLFIAYRKGDGNKVYLSILFTSVCVGFISADIRTITVKAPVLEEDMDAAKIYGVVEQILLAPDSKRLLVGDLNVNNMAEEDTPKFIRINVKTDISNLEIGDRITFRATLIPPPLPSYPGGFDFSRFAYFKQIGGIGYAVSKIYVISKNETIGPTQYIEKVRKNILDRIRLSLPDPESGVTAGLLVGYGNFIEKDVYDYIRISGIAHIIAISGMHIVVVVGMVFVLARTLLSKIPFLAMRLDLKKLSALIAIIASFIYLILAGSPVSAQRAFIMSALVLAGIILDREASAMRSIAIAAILILIVTPENIMSASLHMSFAACITLIASYSFIIDKLKIKHLKSSLLNKFFSYFISIVSSTLIAGTATAPFVVYHFNQFSTYSVLTNLLAIPLSDFIIMPLGMFSLLLMPFGLDAYLLKMTGYAVHFMLLYAKFTSSLPNASIYVPKFSSSGIGLIAVGGLMLCLMTTKIRYLGISLIVLGFLSLEWEDKPDILVDRNAKLFAIKSEDRHLYVSSNQKSRFVKSTWQQAYDEPMMLSIQEGMIPECNNECCFLNLTHTKAAIFFGQTDYGKDFICSKVDLLINITDRDFKCDSDILLLTKSDFRKNGTHAIWLEPTLKIKTVHSPKHPL